MGGGQTSEKSGISVTQTSPWDPAQPGLMKALTDAGTLYDAGIGNGIYDGQRVAALSNDQSAGIQGVRDQAASDNAGAIGVSGLQNIIQGGGMNPYTQQGIARLMDVQGITAPTVSASTINTPTITAPTISMPDAVRAQSVLGRSGLDQNGLSQGTSAALGQLGGVQGASTADLNSLAQYIRNDGNPVNQTANAFMSGSRDLTTIPQLQNLFNQTQAPSYAEQNLAGVARGDYLDPTTNPYVQALVKNANQNASNATKEAYAASGRYGSGNFAGAMTKAISDVDTNLYANQYNTERQNQLSANQLTDAAKQARLGLGQSITNDISNVQNTNNQNRLAGAGLGQAQQAQAANVLGQVLSGNQFNSNLGLQQAMGALGAYQQGTANRLGALTSDTANDLASQQFNVNANQAAQQYNAGNNMAGQQFNASNNMAGQQFNANALMNTAQFNAGNNMNAQQFNSNLSLQQALGEIGAGQQATNAIMQAASAIPAVNNARYVPSSNLLQAGGLQQTQSQNDLNALMQRFQETQQTPWQALSEYASFPTAIGSMGGQSITNSTERTKTSGASPLQSILGLGTSLLGLSDERVKEDIKEVGELHDGQPIYSYRYKGSPTTQIGLMAQEVAEAKPDAVGPYGIGDLMAVDYAKATEDAAKRVPAPATAPAAPTPSTPSPSDLKGIGQFAASQIAGPMMQAAMQALADSPAAKPKATMVVVQSKVAGKPAKGGKSSKSSKAA